MQSRENRPSLRSACSRDAPIYNISRTEITHWTASPFEDYSTFIKTGTYKNNLVSFFTSNELKLTCKTSVTCTCWLTLESISSCLGPNNLKIMNLFLRHSQEHQTDFQITFKYYLSLGSNRNLGCFGEFPHIKNSILVFAVNCCIYEHYANYVSELCLFGDIFLSKLKNVPFWSC